MAAGRVAAHQAATAGIRQEFLITAADTAAATTVRTMAATTVRTTPVTTVPTTTAPIGTTASTPRSISASAGRRTTPATTATAIRGDPTQPTDIRAAAIRIPVTPTARGRARGWRYGRARPRSTSTGISSASWT